MDARRQNGEDGVERATLEIGRELLQRMGDAVPGVFDRRRWEGRILEGAMADPGFKVDLFRFVDVLPALQTPEQVAEHARQYLLREGREIPGLAGLARKAASWGALSGTLARVVRRNVGRLAGRFIAGQDATRALPVLQALHGDGYAFTVDLLGEATLTEAEGRAYAERYLDLLQHLPAEVARWAADPVIDRNHLGPIPRANISLKLSALEPHLDAVDHAGSVDRLRERILPLAQQARQVGAALHIDLEDWDGRAVAFDLFESLATHPACRDWPHLGFTIQSYLQRAADDAERVLAIARGRGVPVAVRLVKGAYWETEVIRARQRGGACPVFQDKAATDACYEAITTLLLRNAEWVQPAFASHNLRSLAHAVAVAREVGLPPEAVEVQTLLGMAEPERAAFRALGHRVRVYAPVGELLPGMAYLVRRLLENTSNQGFLRLTHREGVDSDILFARPQPAAHSDAVAENCAAERPGAAFRNCPLTDFAEPEARQRFAAAVAAARQRLPYGVPVVVAGTPRPSSPHWEHLWPDDVSCTVTRAALATETEAGAAVDAATAAFPDWRDRPLAQRVALLDDLADRLEGDRDRLAALQVHESAKPWREADADVAEAVDFCRYYARQAPRELGVRAVGSMDGEDNQLWYEGRGPTAVIAPWNFPLAILTGMASAALVAGNPVLLKPAEQSAASAYALFEHLLAVGFPPQVVHLLPGIGEEIGAFLVRDPRVVTIAFTGSKAVGLGIVEQAGKTLPGQTEVKRVVCEMGGKNAIVVDDDADLDVAVAGVLASACGYSGQKCSAASRVVAVGAIAEVFEARLVEACKGLRVGPASDPGCQVGPLIDRNAYRRLREVIAAPGAGATAVYVGDAPEGGWFVPPALFRVTDPQHRLMREEFFGPLLTLCRAESFDRALDIAAATEYALTGAVYSRNPEHLARARQVFRVGNLYLNRKSTGAMVGRQPFGGSGMSGLGTKAGGPGYLLHFAVPRCVTENTVRRGFSPEVQV